MTDYPLQPPGWPPPERITVIMEAIRRRIAECVEEMEARERDNDDA